MGPMSLANVPGSVPDFRFSASGVMKYLRCRFIRSFCWQRLGLWGVILWHLLVAPTYTTMSTPYALALATPHLPKPGLL